MKLTNGSRYAIHALVCLAAQKPNGFTPIPELASTLAAPAPFLSKVFQRLQRHHLVRTATGIYGGFRLARPADEISLLDIIAAVDGPLVAIVPDVAKSGQSTDLTKELAKIYGEAAKQARQKFAAVSLASLAEEERPG